MGGHHFGLIKSSMNFYEMEVHQTNQALILIVNYLKHNIQLTIKVKKILFAN